MSPEISVVIPVRNEVAKIRDCIEGILAQTVPVKEIIVIDSGSTDGTLEILRGYKKVKVLEIPGAEFNHGETRNYGVRHATGEFVILTVGDAKAYDNHWVAHLLDGFENPDVAGVCGQQVCPHDPDKNPVYWYRPQDAPTKTRYHYPNGAFDNLSPNEKLRACGWDDVTAMYRRSVLMEIPFRFTSFCEDAIWAKDALRAGHAIVYNPAARVYHYHNEDPDFTFKRTLTTIYVRYKHFGFAHQPVTGKNYIGQLRRLKTLFLHTPISLKEKLHWVKYNNDGEAAYFKAINTFCEALEKGEEVLDSTHQKYCGKPPIPLK